MLKKLVEKAIGGDEESFRYLIQQRKESIYRIAYSYVNNSDDALDVVQEAVYKAFISLKNLKHPEYFNTWLTRITINCAIDILRQKNKLVYLDKEENLVDSVNSYSTEEIIDLQEALNKLDITDKTIIILKYFEDITLSEIAETIKIPLSTVKTRLYRALARLKIDLEEADQIG